MSSDPPARSVLSSARPRIQTSLAALLLGAAVSGAALADGLSADDIAAAIGDRTYQGSMTADAFAEYYAADGTVRGDGYTGCWRAEGDTLCLAYDGADEQRWGVELDGPAMMPFKDGEVDGSGMPVEGNPLGL